MRPYLDPTAPIASDAVLTDDPKGAMELAVRLTESPRMSNLAHGLWGYHGTTREGCELTIQAIGIGGPSAFCVVSDLTRLGVERMIRIGSCVALDPALGPGTVVVAGQIEPCDGVGRAVCERACMVPDGTLTQALVGANDARTSHTVRSVDLYQVEGQAAPGVAALDLSSGAVAGAAARSGASWACALVVAETAGGARMEDEALDEALLVLGRRAGDALGAVPQTSAP